MKKSDLQPTYRFRAVIYSVGVNRCVDVPSRVSRSLGADHYIPVRVTIAEFTFASRLVPRGEGLHRLFVHSRIWKALGVDRGDEITVVIGRGEAPAEVVLPDDVREAFSRDQEARRAYDAMTIAGRQQFVRWINETKTAATRERRIQTGMERLIDNARKKRRKS